MDSKSKYKAWEQWITNAMQSLTEMNADSRSTTMATFSAPTPVQPVLLADSQPAPTGGVMVSNSDFRVLLAKVETTMGKVETMEARQNAA